MGISSGLGGYTPPGLVLIKSQTFSSQTNCDVTDVFSANYENYFAIARVASSLTGQYTDVQLLNGTTPKTTNYSRSGFVSLTTGVTGSDSAGTSQSAWRVSGQSTTGIYATLTFYRPFATAETGYSLTSSYNGHMYLLGGIQTESYSATGFRILANGNAATYTGTIRVYGYKD